MKSILLATIATIFILFSVNSSFAQETSASSSEEKSIEKDNQELINKILIVADSMFSNKNWDAALKYYHRVVGLSPKNIYAKQQIKEITYFKRQENNDKTNDILNNAKNAQERRIENNYYD